MSDFDILRGGNSDEHHEHLSAPLRILMEIIASADLSPSECRKLVDYIESIHNSVRPVRSQEPELGRVALGGQELASTLPEDIRSRITLAVNESKDSMSISDVVFAVFGEASINSDMFREFAPLLRAIAREGEIGRMPERYFSKQGQRASTEEAPKDAVEIPKPTLPPAPVPTPPKAKTVSVNDDLEKRIKQAGIGSPTSRRSSTPHNSNRRKTR